MKHSVWITALVAITLLASCAGGDFFARGATVGADAAAQTAAQSSLSSGLADAYNDSKANPYLATPTSLTPTLATATLPALAGQRLAVTFTNGVVDTGSIATGILVYQLLATANAAPDNSFARGTALVPSVTSVLPDGSGGCTVYLTLDLSGTLVSSRLEVQFVASALTASGGTSKLNKNGNHALGEATADDYYLYPTVTGAPVTAAGAQRNPLATVSFTQGTGPALAATTATFAVSDVAGTFNIDPTALNTALVWSKLNATGGWDPLAPTGAYSATTGVLTYTFSAAFANGDIFRVVYDTNNIKESQLVNGLIHQLGYLTDPANRYGYFYYGVNATAAPFANLAATGLGASAYAASTTDLSAGHDWSVTNQTFSVALDGAAPVTVTLNTAVTSLNAGATTASLVFELNTALFAATGFPTNITTPSATTSSIYAQAWDSNGDGTSDSIRLRRGSNFAGSGKYFTLAAGVTADALATLGLTAGTYVGMDVFSGNKTTGVSLSGSAGNYFLDLNFGLDALNKGIDQTTVTPTSLRLFDNTTKLASPAWNASGAVWFSANHVRIPLPASFANGTYVIRVEPTVKSLGGLPCAVTTRLSNLGVYFESLSFTVP